ncbi:uncharacterized protein OCT59_002556 [Rhizophagus irregularis]|uniref:uncharacterized protein n=1 Tax=Rhizophagus irregularis TaxID=588596 RepID=UPI00331697EA|nr:hypothetical protein OCT59_002556 [Rhizophagus irregularis]
MPTDLYTKIYNFLLNAEEEDITAGSVIYQGIEDNPWISQNELKSIIERAVAFVKNQYERGSSCHTTLLEVLLESVVTYIWADSTHKMDLANIIRYFKGNLAKITVFSAKITACPTGGQQKPVEDMVPSSLPQIIWEKCDEFVVNFAESNISVLPQKLSHNGEWKESDEELADVTSRILGTYVTNVIVPAIRATLKGLPLGRSSYVSSAERQSSASADRKGEGRTGRRPDIMFVMKHDGKKYELIYVESSRLSCIPQKEKDDEIKLWRETNDGMYWVHKSSGLDKGEFRIIGIQVAG